ncbi:serine/threonine protein phosphatase [Actibacterium sp. 188UL27-1]|nr:serine/threonine protein phosphatase [Actibacterium sp. 188UL27-1]
MYWALDGQLAWQTHLGGFLIGCVSGYLLDAPERPHEDPPTTPRPDRLTYIIGDIHGCLRALEALLSKIDTHRQGRPADLVFVGDYVDRGPDSAAVLNRLMALDNEPYVTCLMGNHDLMMLRFLQNPDQRAAGWIGAGGQDTLFSFGLTTAPQGPNAAARHQMVAENLRKAMPPNLEAWLAARPLWWQSGDVIVVHALTQPDKPMSAQSDEVLLWARPTRNQTPRSDGTWVIHGHTIVAEPRITPGHIAIDTGAYRGRPLTAVVLGNGPPEFLQVTSTVEIAAQTG